MERLTPKEIHEVLLYTTKTCPYCHRAKALLRRLGIPFQEVDLTGKEKERAELTAQTRWKTVPQIFVNGKFIGGYEELSRLLGEKEEPSEAPAGII